MTEGLAELLADTDNPDAIADLLEFAAKDRGSSTRSESEPVLLQELYERFLSRRQNRSPATRAQYRRTIPDFIDFATANDTRTSAEITVDILDAYVDRLQVKYGADATVLTYTKNVRSWLRWLNKRNYCSETIYRILDKDELGLSPAARDEALPADEADILLSRLRQQRHGAFLHALIELLWNAGPRIGGVRSLDLRDFNPRDNEIRLRHRPAEGTRLKNGSGDSGDGERNVVLTDCVVDTLETYIRYERPDVTDEYGREPLFATQYGRASRSTLRRKVYEATSCRWLIEREPERPCDGDCDPDSGVCPYSYYPHAIRRGAIVRHLSGGLPPHIASERFDVSVQIIRKHYDPRSKRKQKEDRLNDVRDSWD